MKLDTEAGKDLAAGKEIARVGEKEKEKSPVKGAKGGMGCERDASGNGGGKVVEVGREKENDALKEKEKEKEKGENSGMISPESLEAT